MLSPEDSKPATETKYGAKGSRGKWAGLSDEKREQYERIEERVRDKMEKGEL